MEKVYLFYVHGMHCNSCVLLTESDINNAPGVSRVKASLKNHQIEITGDFGEKTPEEVLAVLSPVIKEHGYTLALEKQNKKVAWSEFSTALPGAGLFIAAFIILQELGIVNLIGAGDISYPTVFLIGIIASLSTCMAIVGGLVLSVSASFAKEGDKVRPQVLFHIGRLVSFFILGGAIGALGSVFHLGNTGTLALGILVALVMFILGINLLDIFPWAKNLQPTLPRFISKHLLQIKKVNHTLTPLLVGVITFFLPCGFTQSMQIYSLTTGSPLTGALTMFVFALGTLPALAALSFASLGIQDKNKSGTFFKTAGLIVIFFALFNLMGTLVSAGILPPIFNI
jgi:uncharacterized protein